MVGKRKFIYNGIVLTLLGFAIRGVALFLGAYVASLIGAEGVGLQGLIATVYSFAVTFATSGVSLSVTRLVAASIGAGEGSKYILKGAFIYAFCFGLVASAVLFIFADFIGMVILADMRVASSLRILSLSLLPISLSAVISGYFVSVRRVVLNAIVQISGQIMRIALTVILLGRAAGGGISESIRALALGVTITEIVCFIIALIEFLIDVGVHRYPNKQGAGLSEVSKMALPLALSAYVRAFLLSVEHNLIPRRLEDRGHSRSEALRSYGYLGGMALPIILFPMTPLSSFSGLLVPEFAESQGVSDQRRMERMTSLATEKALIYAITVAVFIFAFSEELGYVIYNTYTAGRYIGLLAPVIPIMYLDHVVDSILKGIGEHVYSMWVNILDSFLSVILVWAFIPIMGIYGYAIVIIIMECFNFLLSYVRLRKVIRFKLNVFRAVLMPALASIIAVTLAKMSFDFSGRGATWLWLCMQITFALTVCVAIMYASKTVLKEIK